MNCRTVSVFCTSAGLKMNDALGKVTWHPIQEDKELTVKIKRSSGVVVAFYVRCCHPGQYRSTFASCPIYNEQWHGTPKRVNKKLKLSRAIPDPTS